MAAATVRKVITGDLFFAPCLKDIEGKEHLGRRNFGDDVVV